VLIPSQATYRKAYRFQYVARGANLVREKRSLSKNKALLENKALGGA